MDDGDVIIIVNVNGINAITIDSALTAKEMGAKVIAVTSRDFANNVDKDIPARHPSNKNLHELGDVVIDVHVPVGDAVLNINNIDHPVASTSTFAICFALDVLVARVAEELVKRGVTPEIWKSGNVKGGDEANQSLREKYSGRIYHLPGR